MKDVAKAFLSIAIGILCFITEFGSKVLNFISGFLLFMFIVTILIGEMKTEWWFFIGAFILSPYGLPSVAVYIIAKLTDIRDNI